MRIRILPLLFFIASGITAHSQPSGQFGFKGGLTVSSLGTTGGERSAKLGYHFGFYGEKRFYQEVGVQSELMISLQGARATNFDRLKLNYTYLVLPVIVNLYFSENAAVDLGLQGGYLLRAIENDGGNKINIRDNVNNWDLSGIVGLSYGKPFGKIGIRYVLGITNTNGAWFNFNTNSKNQVLQIFLAAPLVVYE